MTKKERYQILVRKRQIHKFSNGLNNPSDSGYDWNEIEPWAKWHNDLDADILVIGQEFSDFKTYQKCKGRVEVSLDKYDYPSNKNLSNFFHLIGIKTGHPLTPNKNASLFFTNCVMGLKDGSMSSN